MKLNNKGFAITAVLYGLLILFVILVSSYLLVLSAKKDRVNLLTSEIENSYVNEHTSVGKNLLKHIKKLYTDGNPTLITQEERNDKYYYSYQDTTKTWGLMNDGLKIASTSGTGATTITNTNTLVSGTEGNIRYFGPSNKVNNYIYFNCSNYSNQSDSTCEKWRIIGIVDGKVKIIREKLPSDDELAWDQDKNQDSNVKTYSNNWETSSLQLMLNSSYYYGDTSGTITYISSNGSKYTTLNMSSIGIKNNKTRDMISKSTWYLGGIDTSDYIYANDIYNYERTKTVYNGNPFTIDANIGIMYLSDYGYGTNLTKCSYEMLFYNEEECITNNWLFNNGISLWLITPVSNKNNTAFFVYEDGSINEYGWTMAPYGVYPVLYLKTNLSYVIGDGSFGNPYQLSV